MNAETVFVSTLAGLAASVFGTPMAHWLARRTHISQRWWERKAEAYDAILLALAEIRTAFHDLLDELPEGPGQAEAETLERVMKVWDDAAGKVGRVANQGTFRISTDATRILFMLEEPLRTRPRAGEESQWMCRIAQELSSAVAAIGLEAKRDLGVLRVRDRYFSFRRSDAASHRN